jgi:hypothetical protein
MEYEITIAKLEDLMKTEPTVRQALDMLVGLKHKDMLTLASWMIAKSVELIHVRRGMQPRVAPEEGISTFPDKDFTPAFVNLVAQAFMKYLRFGQEGLRLSPKNDPFGDEEFTDEEIDQLDIDDNWYTQATESPRLLTPREEPPGAACHPVSWVGLFFDCRLPVN